MSTSSRSAERFKYGICLNDECPECKAKKVHQIPMRKDLVCPECGKPLRECHPPNQGGNKKLIAIVVGVVVVLGIGGGIFALSGGDDGTTTPPQGLGPDTTIVEKVDSDSIKAAQLAAAEAAKLQAEQEAKKKPEEVKKPQPSTGGSSKNLGYATFKGSWPNDVNGRMIFKSSHVIDSKDPKGRVAEAGDYVIGECADGHLVQGIWYGADNQVKGSVIIGR
jgi:hypothetical protein